MAFPNLSEIVTTTLRNRTGQLADNMSRNNALLARLSKRGRMKTFSGGRTIVQELNYANNQTFQWYSGYQTLNIAPSQTFSAAEFPIRQSAVAVSISGLEELQNSGEEAIIDLLESRIENAEDTFMNGMSQGVYGDGTVTGSVNGVQLLVSSSPGSGIVGGIDRATWTFWQNQAYGAVTNGGAAATAANIQNYMDSLWLLQVRGRDSPDLIVADNNMYKFYWQSLQAIQRIASENGAGEHGALGFQSLKYNTADVVLDGGFQGYAADPLPYQTSGGTSAVGGAPANTMYMLNTKYIHWRPHSRRNMVPLDPDRFSVNQDAMVKLIGWAGNMTLSNAFLQGVLYNT
jgi:hypothetical protein